MSSAGAAKPVLPYGPDANVPFLPLFVPSTLTSCHLFRKEVTLIVRVEGQVNAVPEPCRTYSQPTVNLQPAPACLWNCCFLQAGTGRSIFQGPACICRDTEGWWQSLTAGSAKSHHSVQRALNPATFQSSKLPANGHPEGGREEWQRSGRARL